MTCSSSDDPRVRHEDVSFVVDEYSCTEYVVFNVQTQTNGGTFTELSRLATSDDCILARIATARSYLKVSNAIEIGRETALGVCRTRTRVRAESHGLIHTNN